MARMIIHDRYGRLNFVKEVEPKVSKSGNKARMALWKCDCGNEKVINISNVKQGKTTSCGCFHKEIVSEKSEPPIHKRFGSLVVLSEVEERIYKGKKARYMLCECDCGAQSTVSISNLQSGHTTSCGCSILNIKPKNIHDARKVWGEERTNDPYYRRYHSMIQRCYNPNNSNWANYGARGIDVCDEWQGPEGFSRYKDHITSLEGFSDDKQIDRIDNNKGYYPDNVRAVTSEENNINKRSSRRYYIFGNVYLKARDAAEAYDVSINTIYKWCGLFKNIGKQRPGCFSELLYED